jgi:raffinose/stachyose/melibiose transport system substrate-binding protein
VFVAPAMAQGDPIGGSLVIWEHTPQFEAPLKAVIEGFKEQYPDVDIEYEIKTSDQYYNLLATTIQAGEAPDLFWTNGTATSNLPGYVAQGVVMDLTDKVDLSLFSDKMLQIVTVDEKPYASPTVEVGGRAVFYNKDVFADLGLEVPKTFSEFEALLPKIQDAGLIPISFSGKDPWSVLFHFEPVLAAMSSDWLEESEKGAVAVNDPRVVAAYDKMLEWADAGYYGPGFTGVDGGGALLAFSKGEAVMLIDGTWNVLTIQQNNPDLNFGAFQLPTEEGVRPFVGTSSCGFSVSANSQNPDAALAFANYFASLDGQSRWVGTLNGIPGVSQIQAADPIINEISQFDVMVESYYNILGNQAADGENPRKVWEETQTNVMSKGITPQAFTDDLQSMMKP